MKRQVLPNDLGLIELLPIVNRVLDLVPLVRAGLSAGAPAAAPAFRLRFEAIAELFEVVLDGGIGVYVYAAAGEDHPQPTPLGGPAFYVLAAQVGLYDPGRVWVLAHESILRRGIEQERFVQAGLDAVEWLDPGELGERDAVVPDLLLQVPPRRSTT